MRRTEKSIKNSISSLTKSQVRFSVTAVRQAVLHDATEEVVSFTLLQNVAFKMEEAGNPLTEKQTQT